MGKRLRKMGVIIEQCIHNYKGYGACKGIAHYERYYFGLLYG